MQCDADRSRSARYIYTTIQSVSHKYYDLILPTESSQKKKRETMERKIPYLFQRCRNILENNFYLILL